jgi:hypothetical protein
MAVRHAQTLIKYFQTHGTCTALNLLRSVANAIAIRRLFTNRMIGRFAVVGNRVG